jgi:hypothetical protein
MVDRGRRGHGQLPVLPPVYRNASEIVRVSISPALGKDPKIQESSEYFGFRQQPTDHDDDDIDSLPWNPHAVQHPLSITVAYCYSFFGTFLSSYHPQTIPAAAVVLVITAAISFTTSTPTASATATGTNLPQNE